MSEACEGELWGAKNLSINIKGNSMHFFKTFIYLTLLIRVCIIYICVYKKGRLILTLDILLVLLHIHK